MLGKHIVFFCPSPRKGIFQDSPRGAIRPKERTPSAMICQSAKPAVEFGLEQGDERGSTVKTDVPNEAHGRMPLGIRLCDFSRFITNHNQKVHLSIPSDSCVSFHVPQFDFQKGLEFLKPNES